MIHVNCLHHLAVMVFLLCYMLLLLEDVLPIWVFLSQVD